MASPATSTYPHCCWTVNVDFIGQHVTGKSLLRSGHCEVQVEAVFQACFGHFCGTSMCPPCRVIHVVAS